MVSMKTLAVVLACAPASALRRASREAQAGWGVPPDERNHSGMHCGELKVRADQMISEGKWPIKDPAVRGGAVPCVDGMAGRYPCNGIDLLSHIPLSDFTQQEANDIWGWTDPETKKEYAMMGVRDGTVFVDVSIPTNPQYIVYIKTHTTSSTWRDIKVHANRAYIVSEARGHGLQVYDLTRLRDVSTLTEHSPDHHLNYFGNAHNIVINEDTARAYAVGANQCRGGLLMMDISAPEPVVVGCFDSDGYTHDAHCVVYKGPDTEHVGKEICAAFNENTLTMVDVTNATSPVMLSRTPYAGSKYTHQGWFDEEQKWIYANDELDEECWGCDPTTKTILFNAEDLDDVKFVDYYRHSTDAIDHNAYVLNGFLYEGNYCAGLRILKIWPDHMLSEVAFFDMEEQCDTATFEGVWSVYPYFDSGTIVVSSIEKGLFVLKAQPFNVLPTTTPVPTPAPVGECPWHGCFFGCSMSSDCQFCEGC